MEVAARPAAHDDLPCVVELIAAAIAEQRSERGGEIFATHDARAEVTVDGLGAWLDRAATAAFVGTIDDAILGVATVHVEDLRNGGRLAVVDELYVEAGARGVGVGEAMMDAVVAWAEDRKCAGIDAMVLPGNRESKNFFETFGLTARAIVVHRALPARPTD